MLVSHRLRFIYTKTAKTGGTSVESYFERFCMADGAWTESHAREAHESKEGIIGRRGAGDGTPARWWNHMPAADIRREIGEATWNAYFKFCVIRNPFEKAVSAFIRRKQDPTKHDLSLPESAQFERWLEAEGPYTDEAQYMIDGRFALDATIRHERMADDMAAICARLGIAWEPERMPTFKAGIRPKDATVPQLFTPKSRETVERICARELALFGYAFPA